MTGLSEAGSILRRLGLDPSEYFDPLLSEAFGRPVFDAYKFDDWLTGNFGEEGLSSREILRKRFPDIADTLEGMLSVKGAE